jgi:hypothetical protein
MFKYILIIIFFGGNGSQNVTFEKFKTRLECESVRKSFNIMAEKRRITSKKTQCVAIDKHKNVPY